MILPLWNLRSTNLTGSNSGFFKYKSKLLLPTWMLQWISIASRIKYKLLAMVYKTLHNVNPPDPSILVHNSLPWLSVQSQCWSFSFLNLSCLVPCWVLFFHLSAIFLPQILVSLTYFHLSGLSSNITCLCLVAKLCPTLLWSQGL